MTKLEQLQALLDQIEANRFTPEQRKKLSFADVDGKMVRLDSPDAVEALRARIAKEQG